MLEHLERTEEEVILGDIFELVVVDFENVLVEERSITESIEHHMFPVVDDVFGVDFSVDDPLPVQVVDDFEQLMGDVFDFVYGELFGIVDEVVDNGFSRKILVDDIVVLVGFEIAEDADDAWMLEELGEDVDLLEESLGVVFSDSELLQDEVLLEIFVQNLAGDFEGVVRVGFVSGFYLLEVGNVVRDWELHVFLFSELLHVNFVYSRLFLTHSKFIIFSHLKI